VCRFKEGVVAHENLFPCLQRRHRTASALTLAEGFAGEGFDRQGLQGGLVRMAGDTTGVGGNGLGGSRRRGFLP